MYRRTNAWNLLEELAERANTNTLAKVRTKMDVNEDVLTMNFDVPGLSKSDITIKVEDRVITIAGENEDRTFNKQYKLSDDWDTHRAEAEVTNGVLSLVIPMLKEKKSKVMEIIVK